MHEVVCDEHDIAEYVPDPPDGLIGFDRAVELALQRIQDADVTTRWSSAAVPGAPSDPLPTDPDWAGGSPLRRRAQGHGRRLPRGSCGACIEGDRRRAAAGTRGPSPGACAGWLDRLVGGPGLRRGRRDPRQLLVGDALDFWRVEDIEPARLLRLRAEMRLPGLAWLELRGRAGRASRTPHDVFAQRALFHPHGPARAALLVVGRTRSTASCSAAMQRNIARAAERAERARTDRRVSAAGG